jgi:hypothetical protein
MYVIVHKVCDFILNRICMLFLEISIMNIGVGTLAGIPFV